MKANTVGLVLAELLSTSQGQRCAPRPCSCWHSRTRGVNFLQPLFRPVPRRHRVGYLERLLASGKLVLVARLPANYNIMKGCWPSSKAAGLFIANSAVIIVLDSSGPVPRRHSPSKRKGSCYAHHLVLVARLPANRFITQGQYCW